MMWVKWQNSFPFHPLIFNSTTYMSKCVELAHLYIEIKFSFYLFGPWRFISTRVGFLLLPLMISIFHMSCIDPCKNTLLPPPLFGLTNSNFRDVETDSIGFSNLIHSSDYTKVTLIC